MRVSNQNWLMVLCIFATLTAMTVVVGCGTDTVDPPSGTDADADGDTGTDSDSDGDTDADSDSDSDSDPPAQEDCNDPATWVWQGSGEGCEDPIVLPAYRTFRHFGWNNYYQNGNVIDWTCNDTCEIPWNGWCVSTIEPSDCSVFTGVDPSGANCGVMGPEIVFRADIAAGQKVVVRSFGSDAPIIRVADSCDNVDGTCLVSDKFVNNMAGHWMEWEWIPDAPGAFNLVIEEKTPVGNTINPYYHYHVGVYDDSETDCTDELDNDGDELFDCLDPDCASTCAVTKLFEETFDTDPGTWQVTSTDAGSEWGFSNDASARAVISDSGGGYYRAAYLSSGGSARLITTLESPEIALTSDPAVVLTFAHRRPTLTQELGFQEVRAQVDGGLWVVVQRYDKRNLDYRRNSDVSFETIDLSTVAAGGTTLKLQFIYEDYEAESQTPDEEWQLDDITVVAGDFVVCGGMPANLVEIREKIDDADGCDGVAPVCESLFGHDFGVGSDELGWYYNGQKCEKAVGSLADAGSYCFFGSVEECAQTCAEAGVCNMEAFVSQGWPELGGYTTCEITICTTPLGWTDMQLLWTDDITLTDKASDCGFAGHVSTSAGASLNTNVPIRRTNDENWVYLCGYSLLPEFTELTCVCNATAGCPPF